ncbi:hypothetical protein J2S43_002622 [Catenuloplanes nepalensis]|uniref:Uncharacterized protein n=1 Tax=Catenuloplanes nepalensis TaxID=587533 RepID=A0ABT9MRQ5_9ACTN|nr:hypothetical protein [Catenuloplanes nepalensis]
MVAPPNLITNVTRERRPVVGGLPGRGVRGSVPGWLSARASMRAVPGQRRERDVCLSDGVGPVT